MRLSTRRFLVSGLPLLLVILATGLILSPNHGEEIGDGIPDLHGCTSIMVGRLGDYLPDRRRLVSDLDGNQPAAEEQ